jgi:hypothetical protein
LAILTELMCLRFTGGDGACPIMGKDLAQYSSWLIGRPVEIIAIRFPGRAGELPSADRVPGNGGDTIGKLPGTHCDLRTGVEVAVFGGIPVGHSPRRPSPRPTIFKTCSDEILIFGRFGNLAPGMDIRPSALVTVLSFISRGIF